MLNIFKQEIVSHKKHLLLWSVGIIFLIVMGMAKMSAYHASGESINKLFAELPKVFKAITGATGFDLSSAKGFFALLFLYIAVMVAIEAVLVGTEIVSKEERDKTTEFLLTKPLTRTNILVSKILAGLVIVLVLSLVTTASSLLIVGAYNQGVSINYEILKLMGGMVFMQLVFYSVGLAIAASSKKARSTTQIGSMIVLGAYLAFVLVGLFDSLNWLKYLTPFQYFEANTVLISGYSILSIGLSLLIIFVSLIVAIKMYSSRDQTLT